MIYREAHKCYEMQLNSKNQAAIQDGREAVECVPGKKNDVPDLTVIPA